MTSFNLAEYLVKMEKRIDALEEELKEANQALEYAKPIVKLTLKIKAKVDKINYSKLIRLIRILKRQALK